MASVTLFRQTSLGSVYTNTNSPGSNFTFIYIPPAQNNLPQSISVSDTYNTTGAFCFFAQTPSSTETATLANLIRRNFRLTVGAANGRGIRVFLWFKNPSKYVIHPNNSNIDYLLASRNIGFFTTSATFPFLNSDVLVNVSSTVIVNSNNTGFEIKTSTQQSTLFQKQTNTSLNLELTSINLSVAPQEEGNMQFEVSYNQDNFHDLDFGLRFFWKENIHSGKTYGGRYPIFDLASSETVQLLGTFNALFQNKAGDNFYSFPQGATAFPSSYRTIMGRQIQMTPVEMRANSLMPPIFNFTPLPSDLSPSNAGFYWAPMGDFYLNIEDIPSTGDSDYQEKWLCGLSGTEYTDMNIGTTLNSNSLFRFVPGQKAFATFDKVSNSIANFGTLSDDNITSYMMLIEGTSNEPLAYYSEPATSPFFQLASGSTEKLILNYLPFSQKELPNGMSGQAGLPSFPAVPYHNFGGAGSSPPIPFQNLALDFEQQVLNPARKSAIAQMSGTQHQLAVVPNTGQKINGLALTPQGYLSTFNQGAWEEIQFAGIESTGQSPSTLSFKPNTGDTSLPTALQSTFLTNQQFLVVSISNDNLGTLSDEVTLSGWSFVFAPPNTQIIGNYHNVLIFKSAKGSISNLVTTPENWTEYPAYNDVTNDPNGLYLSQWMDDYINTAKQIYNNGLGNAAFENFVTLVDDPEWSGFLVLNVDISPNLPENIEALTAGIDTSRFVAHHLGNEVTQAKPDTNGYSQQSAIFALIDYTDPLYEAALKAGGQIPTYIQSSLDYDFKVLSLQVVFENATLRHFSSKLMVLMNNWFQSATIQTAIDSNETATNRLILDGSVQKKDGQNVYLFATPKTAVSRFFLGSTALSEVRVDRAEFNVLGISNSGSGNNAVKHLKTAFSFWGAIGFSNGPKLQVSGSTGNNFNSLAPNFDLFSYAAIQFSNLSLNMDFDLSADSQGEASVSNRTFSFDSSLFQLNPQAIKILEQGTALTGGFNYVRMESWLSQFPMKLKNFIQSTTTDNKTPTSLGYSLLSAPPLDKAGLTGTFEATDSWYGLEYTLDFGTMGALANNAVFTANILLAWEPDSGNWFVGLKLPGLGPIDKLLDIDGIVKFGAQSISLNLIEVGNSQGNGTQYQFVINFSSIGLSILSLTFPAKGSTNLVLFGNPDATGTTPPSALGWFGSYVQPQS